MYVTPNHRGKGINKKIIDFLKDWAETKNITELILDVYIDNINAVKAYEKIGFVRHLLEMRMNINKPKAE
jgi:GNAT superfamily N-acetyltransferase